jgi:hypothetical protein
MVFPGKVKIFWMTPNLDEFGYRATDDLAIGFYQ